jgi:hypothetical protein
MKCSNMNCYFGDNSPISWKTKALVLFIVVSCTTIFQRSEPHGLWVLAHSDCGTMDEIVSDTVRDDAEETKMFGRPIR